jgi:hypothetical protein
MNHSQDICDRFWNKVINPGNIDDCWEWNSSKNKDNYGDFQCLGIRQLAHRFAYEYVNGLIPKGMLVLHKKCDNPSCNNPNHLKLGTVQDNMLDKVNKERQAKGSSIATSRLIEKDVVTILEKIKNGIYTNVEDICYDYDMEAKAIYRILNRKGWLEVTQDITDKELSDLKEKILGLRTIKLDEIKVKQIKQLLNQNIAISVIAPQFNVTIDAIYKIKNGRTYQNVTI